MTLTPTVVPPRSVDDSTTARTVTVDCPFCGQRHRHGWPAGDNQVGHRRAHCGLGGYIIATSEAVSA